MGLLVWRRTIYWQDHLITMHLTAKECAYLALGRKSFCTRTCSWRRGTVENPNNITASSKEKAGALANVFITSFTWFFKRLRFGPNSCEKKQTPRQNQKGERLAGVNAFEWHRGGRLGAGEETLRPLWWRTPVHRDGAGRRFGWEEPQATGSAGPVSTRPTATVQWLSTQESHTAEMSRPRYRQHAWSLNGAARHSKDMFKHCGGSQRHAAGGC